MSVAAMMRQKRPRERRTRDDERKAIDLAVQRLHDSGRHAVAEQPADRQRRDGQERQLAEQDERNLRASEAENPKAGQLPAAFGERHARRVVDDAERDDPRKDHVEENREVHVGRQYLPEIPDHGALEAGAGDGRQPLQLASTSGLPDWLSISSAAPDSTSPSRSMPVQRVDVNVRRQAKHVVHEADDRQLAHRPLPFQHLDRHACRRLSRRAPRRGAARARGPRAAG